MIRNLSIGILPLILYLSELGFKGRNLLSIVAARGEKANSLGAKQTSLEELR